jgi:predicted negative regulator of RcsB-dependent stress response
MTQLEKKICRAIARPIIAAFLIGVVGVIKWREWRNGERMNEKG